LRIFVAELDRRFRLEAPCGVGGNIEISDFGVSAFSLFFMQSASFLTFQRGLEKGQGRSNGQTLFGIGRIPSDNYIRDRLDEADPALLQPCLERMETLLTGPPLRQAFGRLGGRKLPDRAIRELEAIAFHDIR
jgi:hypothetical protein